MGCYGLEGFHSLSYFLVAKIQYLTPTFLRKEGLFWLIVCGGFSSSPNCPQGRVSWGKRHGRRETAHGIVPEKEIKGRKRHYILHVMPLVTQLF